MNKGVYFGLPSFYSKTNFSYPLVRRGRRPRRRHQERARGGAARHAEGALAVRPHRP